VSLRLVAVPRTAQVIHLRERPSLPVQQWTDEDWEFMSQNTFGDDRLCGNVVPIRRGSTSEQIREVRIAEERRGRRLMQLLGILVTFLWWLLTGWE